MFIFFFHAHLSPAPRVYSGSKRESTTKSTDIGVPVGDKLDLCGALKKKTETGETGGERCVRRSAVGVVLR
jgi:hypothetical protein